MRKVFFVVSILAVASVVLQFYFAGLGVFSHPEDELFIVHAMNGRMVLPILFLLSIITAAIARAGKKTIWLTVLAFGLLILQTLIFIITGLIFGVGPESAEIPLAATMTVSLHALNGVAILFVTGLIIRRAFVLAFRTPKREKPAVVTEDAATDAAAPDAAQTAPAAQPAP